MIALPYAKIAIIASLLIAGFYAGMRWESSRLEPLKSEISRLQAREVIYEQANSQCAQNVKAANEAVNGILRKAKENADRSKAALKAAQIEAAKFATDIRTLRATAAPADTSCQAQSDAARSILLDEVKRRAN
jgi:hypothetical protein